MKPPKRKIEKIKSSHAKSADSRLCRQKQPGTGKNGKKNLGAAALSLSGRPAGRRRRKERPFLSSVF